jgi:Uma2 family endonuclease
MNVAKTWHSIRSSAPPSRDDEFLWEIVAGEWVPMPAMSVYSAVVASRIAAELNQFIRDQELGRVVCQGLFHLSLARACCRRPDVGYVSYERWPKTRPLSRTDNAWDIIPDLVIEVISPKEPAELLLEKIDEYFAAEVRQVWVIYPNQRMAHVYDSPTMIRCFTPTDTLDGGKVLPGFQLPLASLFQAAGA